MRRLLDDHSEGTCHYQGMVKGNDGKMPVTLMPFDSTISAKEENDEVTVTLMLVGLLAIIKASCKGMMMRYMLD